jgi:hypothetical protein
MPLGDPKSENRFLRMHAFEILIFVVMAILFAMCLCASPLIASETPEYAEPTPASLRAYT